MSHRPPSIAEQIDKAVAGLAELKVREDPLLGPERSRYVSVATSAQKRDGHVIEAALIDAVNRVPGLRAWRVSAFRVSVAADQIVGVARPDVAAMGDLPYETDRGRIVQVDMMVYDELAETLNAYEVKRGNAHHDGGKVRSMMRDILCVQLLLRSWGASQGLRVKECRSRAIFYYGVMSIHPPLGISGHEIDRLFGARVLQEVERAHDRFGSKVRALLGRLAARSGQPWLFDDGAAPMATRS